MGEEPGASTTENGVDDDIEDSDESEAEPTGRAAAQLGVSLSPRSYGETDFVSFFELAAEMGSVVRWGGRWDDLAESDSGPGVVAGLAEQYDYDPVFEVNVFDASTGEAHRPLTEENREEYVYIASEFAAEHRPPYLGLGVEANILWENDPDEFDRFVQLFEATKAAVASVSPETTVSVGFQLERLRGLQGGLFGGENDPSLAAWDLIDRFPSADLVGFTTYPGLIYKAPDEIPDDYFDAIPAHVDRRVAITETGWSAGTVASGWESSEAEQAQFVERLLADTAPLDLQLLLWSFMYDQAAVPPAFEGMSLRRDDGTPRPAWDDWTEAAASAETDT
ncbi:hypothetical protein [Haloarchaeobius sp. DFWS5]|uniref:hypothetical protein n=1 Tax=Haloarchaeobius sp. DFWS5 TaxID=3446114 RepID=UPI003EB69AB2